MAGFSRIGGEGVERTFQFNVLPFLGGVSGGGGAAGVDLHHRTVDRNSGSVDDYKVATNGKTYFFGGVETECTGANVHVAGGFDVIVLGFVAYAVRRLDDQFFGVELHLLFNA